MWRHICLALVILAGIALATPGARAQAGNPVVPEEEECEGAPQRSLVALFATPRPATPAPAPDASDIPQVVSPAGSQEWTSLARAVLACLNTGDYWTLITFFSDDYLLRSFVEGEPADPVGHDLAPFVNAVRGCEECIIEPRTGNDRLALLAIGEPWLLDDGRTGFDITISNPEGGDAGDFFVACIRADDQWLIDQIYPLDAEATPTP
jgi:hypothetical protein